MVEYSSALRFNPGPLEIFFLQYHITEAKHTQLQKMKQSQLNLEKQSHQNSLVDQCFIKGFYIVSSHFKSYGVNMDLFV